MGEAANLSVRLARPGDEAFILEMIKELAAYENEADAVRTTEDTIAKWLFEQPVAECLIGSIDGVDKGIALFFICFSTWEGPGLFLEDFVVAESARGQGLGIGLMRELAHIALKRGYTHIDWNCLDWNEPSLALYKALGATARTEWMPHRLALEHIKALASTGE